MRYRLFALVLLIGLPLLGPVQAAPEQSGVTAIYILAFDNDPASSVNLATRYPAALQSIAAATTAERRAIILADLSGPADTRILVVENQTITQIVGLPNGSGSLTTQIQEYNTASGAALGGFLLWALTNYPATVTVVSYVGHGAPLAPDTDIAAALDLDADGAIPNPNINDAFLPPLPIHVDVNAALTDHTSGDLITPYDLSDMLRPANTAGLPQIAVLDLVHCFSSTIEELHEITLVRNATGEPFARTMVASPNYTFFAPTMLGEALHAITPTMTPALVAEALVGAYDQHILTFDGADTVEHPRILVGVDTGNLALIKPAWDRVAYHLLQDFAANRPKLAAAYQSDTTNKYDTTFCLPPDYQLSVPDGLVDLTRLARELSLQYPASDPIAVWSVEAVRRLDDAVITDTFRSGAPWFAGDPPPQWDFEPVQGIAISADFAGNIAAGCRAGFALAIPLVHRHRIWWPNRQSASLCVCAGRLRRHNMASERRGQYLGRSVCCLVAGRTRRHRQKTGDQRLHSGISAAAWHATVSADHDPPVRHPGGTGERMVYS